MNRLTAPLLTALYPLAVFAGCAGNHPHTPPDTSPSTQSPAIPQNTQPTTQPILQSATQPDQPSIEKPFMFDEASLPEGFPPPGPVGQIIIKHYPAYRMARVQSASLGSTSQNKLFGTLFNHIKQNKIAMTAPVEMTYQPATQPQADPQAMAFMYKSFQTGPTGTQGQVQVLDVPPMTVISISFRGSYTDANHAKAIAKLNAWLQLHADQYKPAGPTRYLGYNSPFVPPFLRISESQIPIAPVNALPSPG